MMQLDLTKKGEYYRGGDNTNNTNRTTQETSDKADKNDDAEKEKQRLKLIEMSRTARILQDVLKSEKYGLDEYISDFA
jgi:hypothetical protein